MTRQQILRQIHDDAMLLVLDSKKPTRARLGRKAHETLNGRPEDRVLVVGRIGTTHVMTPVEVVLDKTLGPDAVVVEET